MKKINLKISAWALALLSITILMHSCKRDSNEAMAQLNQALIGKAKQFYQRETINFESRNKYVLSSEKAGSNTSGNVNVNPIWDKASIEITSTGKKLVTVPIPDFRLNTKTSAYERKIIFAAEGEMIKEGHILEVFSSPTEISTNGEKRLLDAADGNMSGFTGAVMKYNLSYIFYEGRYYENGKVRDGIAKIAKQKTLVKGELALPGTSNVSGGIGKISSSAGSISAIIPEFEGQDCENYYLVYIERDSYGNIVYWENRGYQYTICKSTNPGSPNPGGSNTDIYVDCHREVFGNAYEDACGDCVGGSTGLEPCPPVAEIKLDSLKKYFPCMEKLIMQKLQNDSLYSKMIQPFQSVYLPGAGMINFRGLPQLTYGFNTQPWGGTGTSYSMGNTGYSGYSATINFNEAALRNASQLYLQVATLHETSHGYLNYYMKVGVYGYPIESGADLTWALKMVNYGVLASGQEMMANYTHHSAFLINYFDKMVSILKSVNGGAYTDQEYRMAVLYGMNNPGDPPATPLISNNGVNLYYILKDQLNNTYNQILNHYGITPAMLNSFHHSNLVGVPASKKLPNTCP